MSASRILFVLIGLVASFLGVSCETGKLSPAQEAQMALIKAEPRGDYYIGRRWVTYKTHFWGYVRRPGESWDKAKLVVMKEDIAQQPDRLPERPRGAHGFGFDHNYEYKLKGRFLSEPVYDPNSNWFLPWFQLESYELISANPGWLFSPDETYDYKKLPPKKP